MNRQDFLAKYRPLMLTFVAEAWAIRKEPPSAVGQVMDQQLIALRAILNQMCDDLQPTILPANGHLNGHTPRKTTP